MKIQGEKVILAKYIPDVSSTVETIDGKDYLIANDAMYNLLQKDQGRTFIVLPCFARRQEAFGLQMFAVRSGKGASFLDPLPGLQFCSDGDAGG